MDHTNKNEMRALCYPSDESFAVNMNPTLENACIKTAEYSFISSSELIFSMKICYREEA